MDIWTASDNQIKAIAERQRPGHKAISIYRPSGLYAWVTMDNGENITIHENEL